MTEIALALGGGGARGLAHIHVLHAFDDLGIKPSVISGSSIGAIIGSGYASGMSAQEIQEYVVRTFSDARNVMAKLWKIRPASFQGLFREAIPLLGEMNAGRVVDAFLPDIVPATFEETLIELRLTATDYYAAELKLITSGPLRPAIAASAALPVIFQPVEIDGRILYDGGFFSPVPFDQVGENGEIVVGVDVVGMPPCEDESKSPSRLDAAFGVSQLMQQSIIGMQLERSPPTVMLRPPVGHYGVLDFFKTQKILNETASLREEAKREISKVLDQDQKQITGSK